MPKSRQQKTDALASLTEAFKSGKSVMFADYQGMTVSKVTELRKKMDAEGVKYIVAKKTLLRLAAKEAGFDIMTANLPGMLGAAFTKEDEMAAAKLIGDAGKDTSIKLVGGIFDGKVVDGIYATSLSKLPSKSQLLGQLLSVLNGPASAFVRLINAKSEQMGGGVVAAEAKIEAPVEAPVAEPAAEPVATEAPAAS
ncbi:50S ribosomal protein L10 [Patescibacteria group bacterium]|nr:50S ribosomal protein L10 [Patescibacteria group bacterium]